MRASAVSHGKKVSSTYTRYACGTFLPNSLHLLRLFAKVLILYNRHGRRWFYAAASLFYKLAFYRCARMYIDRKTFFNGFLKAGLSIYFFPFSYRFHKYTVLLHCFAFFQYGMTVLSVYVYYFNDQIKTSFRCLFYKKHLRV